MGCCPPSFITSMRCVSPPPPDPRPGEWGRLHLQPQPGEHHRQVPRPRGPHPQGRWGGAGRISGGSFDAEHQPPFPPISLPPGAEARRALLHPGCGGRGVGSDHEADPALPGADDKEEEGESREQGHGETAPSQCRDTPVPFPPPTTCPTPPQDVDAAAIKVQVCLYAFDLLYLNGEVSVRPWRGDIKSPGGGGGDIVPPGGVSPCPPAAPGAAAPVCAAQAPAGVLRGGGGRVRLRHLRRHPQRRGGLGVPRQGHQG